MRSPGYPSQRRAPALERETWTAMNAVTPFLDVCQRNPGGVALRDDRGRSLTYGEIRAGADVVARLLRRHGVRSGDRVLIQVPVMHGLCAATFGTLMVGAVPVLFEPGMPDGAFAAEVKRLAPAFWLVHPLAEAIGRTAPLRRALARRGIVAPPAPERRRHHGRATRIPVSRRILRTRSFLGARGLRADRDGNRRDAVVEVGRRDDAILVSTGGTTGEPRSVRHSHASVGHFFGNLRALVESLDFGVVLADTAPQVLYALYFGRTALVVTGKKARRPSRMLELARAGAFDTYFGSPYAWTEMMSLAGTGAQSLPSSLKTVLLGGAPVGRVFLQRLLGFLHPDTEVRVVYGMTEAGPLCTVRARDKLDYAGEGDLVGAPLPGVRFESRGGGDTLAPIGAVGEIVVHTLSCFSGYAGSPTRDEGEGLSTGDLGSLVEHGGETMLALFGRAKDMIIRRGQNLYPVGLEPLLRSLEAAPGTPMFRDVALIGLWNDGRQDEDLVLCFVPGAAPVTDDEMRRRVAIVLGGSAPDHYLSVGELPVAGRLNKVDKRALMTLAAQRFGLAQRGPASVRAL